MKQLFYDVETMGERGWYFPPRYDTNIIHVDHHEHLLSVAWSWNDEKKVNVLGLDDFPGYAKDKHNDRELAEFIRNLFNEADIVGAHNGDSFDQKVVQARMMTHHLPPPSPYRQIDTKKVAKRYARFASNKLDDLGKQLELGQKLSHGNFVELWLAADEGDPKAWKMMKRYNKQDVVLLKQLYLELRPWIQNHPSLSVMLDRPDACPKCGEGPMIRAGLYATKVNKVINFRCAKCGGYSKQRMAIQTPVHYVN